MSEIFKISLTALFGIAVFTAGQILQRMFVEPIQELRKVIGRIAFALSYYANLDGMVTSGRDIGNASQEIRLLGAELRAAAMLIPFYKGFSFLRLVPNLKAIDEASKNLIGWSNSIGSGSGENRNAIATALSLNIASAIHARPNRTPL